MNHGLSRKEEIRRVAARMFFAKGYAATSMRDLASAVGIKQSALYHHYPSKLDLLFDITKQGQIDLMLAVEKETAAAATTIEELNAFISTHIRYTLTRRGESGLAVEMRHLDEPKQVEMRKLNREYIESLREIMTRGIREGVLRPCNVRFVSLILLNSATFTAAWYDPNGALSIDEMIDIFMDHTWRGLLDDR